jgi:hypothetical protein
MRKNVGSLDRFYRFGIGFLSVALVLVSDSILLRIVFTLVAIFGIVTAFTGYCPLNAKVGVDTTKRKPG